MLDEQGWELIANSDTHRSLTENSNGAYFIALKQKDTGEIIVASPGLESDGPLTTLHDIPQALLSNMGGVTAQYRELSQFVDQVIHDYGKVDLLAAHSLSVSPMQAVSVFKDIDVIAFEPRGQDDLSHTLRRIARNDESITLSTEDIDTRLRDNVTNIFFTHPQQNNDDIGQQTFSRLWSQQDTYLTDNNFHFTQAKAGHSLDPNINELIQATPEDFDHLPLDSLGHIRFFDRITDAIRDSGIFQPLHRTPLHDLSKPDGDRPIYSKSIESAEDAATILRNADVTNIDDNFSLTSPAAPSGRQPKMGNAL